MLALLYLNRDKLDLLSAVRWVRGYADASPFLAIALFAAIYIGNTAFSLPGGLILTVSGGFLFGPVLGPAVVVISATIGACCIFLVARYLLRERFADRIDKWKIGSEINDSPFNYLLMLRLVPAFPFFVVNIAPAFFKVSFTTYALATLIGIIPGTTVYALVGSKFGDLAELETFDAAAVVDGTLIGALIGLAVLAALPIALKKYRARKSGAQQTTPEASDEQI